MVKGRGRLGRRWSDVGWGACGTERFSFRRLREVGKGQGELGNNFIRGREMRDTEKVLGN